MNDDQGGIFVVAVVALFLLIRFRRYLPLIVIVMVPFGALYAIVRFIKWAWTD